jgi:hypothetical protein
MLFPVGQRSTRPGSFVREWESRSSISPEFGGPEDAELSSESK